LAKLDNLLYDLLRSNDTPKGGRGGGQQKIPHISNQARQPMDEFMVPKMGAINEEEVDGSYQNRGAYKISGGGGEHRFDSLLDGTDLRLS